MNIGEIINDSIKYPLSNGRAFPFFGFDCDIRWFI